MQLRGECFGVFVTRVGALLGEVVEDALSSSGNGQKLIVQLLVPAVGEPGPLEGLVEGDSLPVTLVSTRVPSTSKITAFRTLL